MTGRRLFVIAYLSSQPTGSVKRCTTYANNDRRHTSRRSPLRYGHSGGGYAMCCQTGRTAFAFLRTCLAFTEYRKTTFRAMTLFYCTTALTNVAWPLK